MQEIFRANPSDRLQGAVVWTPMLAADDLAAARMRQDRFMDHRVQHYWDPERSLGRLLARTLGLETSIAWDVYLLYRPRHAWDAVLPPIPDIWMHQLGEQHERFLDPLRLMEAVRILLSDFSETTEKR